MRNRANKTFFYVFLLIFLCLKAFSAGVSVTDAAGKLALDISWDPLSQELIFIKNNAVNGLTTAAGVWATAGIGLAMGAGLYAVAIFGTLLIVIIQTLMHKDTFLNKDHLTITFEIELEDSFNSIREIRNCLERFKLEIQNVEIIKKNRFVIVKFYTVVPLDFEREHLEDLIFDDERVKKIEM